MTPQELSDYMAVRARCSVCNRAGFSEDINGKPCDFPQPDGTKCTGVFMRNPPVLPIRLIKIGHDLRFSDRVMTRHEDGFPPRFEFYDATHCHAQFEDRSVSSVPRGTIGAIKKSDGSWWWVIEG